MTAAARLEVLPGGRDAGSADTDWLAPTADAESAAAGDSPWSPEHQLVGALMWLPADAARPIVELIPAAAIEQPVIRWAYETIAHLVVEGRNPDPVLVLATARRRPCSIALDSDAPPSARRHHQLAVYLGRAYTETVSPDNAAGYAREVLELAYQRAFAACGQRMQALAAATADRTELTTQFAAVREELLGWWRRAEAAAELR
jgi:replicative DNA helicase